MKRFRYRLIDALVLNGALCCLGLGVHACGEANASESPEVAVKSEALDLGKECGFVCPGDTDASGVKVKGLAEGNISISGVPSVDGFFASVVSYQTAAKGVAAGIDAELAAIRADFGLEGKADIGVELKAKLDANLEAGYGIKVTPAKCKADIQAELDAAARCDVSASPGMVSVQCSGGCDVEAMAKVSCDAEADLKCTVKAPEVMCSGECTGSCTVDAMAMVDCQGTCNGSCDGTCSAYAKDADGKLQCSGQCSGKCTGKCVAQVTAKADCMGKCSGECVETRKPEAGCEGGIRAQCQAKANAKIKCDTKCDGDFEPPMVKAECKAKVHADAKINVQCTPPHVDFVYKVKGSVNGEAAVRFNAAMKGLISVRLPALKAALARSSLVTSAGSDLSAAAGDAVKGAVNAAKSKSGVDIKVAFGLGCAVDQLGKVGDIVSGANATLKKSVDAAGTINSQLKI
jgi:hypothetical protein